MGANSPTKAIKIAEEYKGDIHLLMTDMVMPEMSGKDLEGKISKIRSGIKCLSMSGYSETIMSNKGVLIAGIHFLAKPLTAAKLSVKLCEAMCIPAKHQRRFLRIWAVLDKSCFD